MNHDDVISIKRPLHPANKKTLKWFHSCTTSHVTTGKTFGNSNVIILESIRSFLQWSKFGLKWIMRDGDYNNIIIFSHWMTHSVLLGSRLNQKKKKKSANSSWTLDLELLHIYLQQRNCPDTPVGSPSLADFLHKSSRFSDCRKKHH